MLLFLKLEFIKEAYSKDLCHDNSRSFYTLTNTIFILLTDFAWTTPKNYDDHRYHPNIGSIAPSPPPVSFQKTLVRIGINSVQSRARVSKGFVLLLFLLLLCYYYVIIIIITITITITIVFNN